jgi:hypothetical protein
MFPSNRVDVNRPKRGFLHPRRISSYVRRSRVTSGDPELPRFARTSEDSRHFGARHAGRPLDIARHLDCTSSKF